MNHPYIDLIDRAMEQDRIHQRWTRHGGPNGPEHYVTVSEEDYAELLFLAGFAPCTACGMIESNVRHDVDGSPVLPRHAYVPPRRVGSKS